MRIRFLPLFLLSACVGNALAAEMPRPAPGIDALAGIPVLDNGRVKPLDAFARETLRMITGKEAFRGAKDPETDARRPFPAPAGTPSALFLSILSAPAAFGEEPLILVQDLDLKASLGVAREVQHLSSRFVREALKDPRGPLAGLVTHAQAKRQAGGAASLTRAEKVAEELYHRYARLDALLAGRIPAVAPLPGRGEKMWLSPGDIEEILTSHAAHLEAGPLSELSAVRTALAELRTAAAANDAAAYDAAAGALARVLRDGYARFLAAAPTGLWSPIAMLDREVLYNRLGLYTWAWIGYLLAFGVFLAARVAKGISLRWTAYALFLAGFAAHLAGFLLRFSIVGVHAGEQARIPLSNLYEALTFIALGVALWGLVFEAIWKTAHVGMVSALGGFLALVVASAFDIFDPRISPVEPALRSHWMNYHVSSMLLGYAGGIVSLGVSHLLLFRFLRGNPEGEPDDRLDHYNYRAMQVAALFIGIGLMLGAVWANESWGRWWGWDPKETWALVTFLVYIITMHARILGVIGTLGTAVLGVVGFATIFMTFYGVNLIGKGLHSYGFFEGGWYPFWGFCLLEGGLLALVGWKRRARSAGEPAP